MKVIAFLFVLSLLTMEFLVLAIGHPIFVTYAETTPNDVKLSLNVEEGSLTEYVRTFESEIVQSGYEPPEATILDTMRNTVKLLKAGIELDDGQILSEAASKASEIQYQLVRFTDTSENKSFYLLTESPGVNRGWGLYVFNARRNLDLVVEVPHPMTDHNTSHIGTRVFLQSGAKAFLMAGAKRFVGSPSDAAHNSTSVFEAVHEEMLTKESIVLQMHSFNGSRYDGYPEVVLSSGDSGISGVMRSLKSSLEDLGFGVGMYDGSSWTKLSAESNVQGLSTREASGTFVQLELEHHIVYSSLLSDRIVEAVVKSAQNDFRFPLGINWKIPVAIAVLVAVFAVIVFVARLRSRR